MRLFARSTRWRQFFFAACLPYIVLSVVVESFHTSPTGRIEPAQTLVSLGSANLAPAPGPCLHAAVNDDSCPACNWLRLGRRLEAGMSLTRTRDVVLERVAVAVAFQPESPIPHPSLFRGPPASLLS